MLFLMLRHPYLMQNKHSSRLEEIVIWLIAVEILIELVKEILPPVYHWVQAKAAASVGKTNNNVHASFQM
jgi:hypothetical protein